MPIRASEFPSRQSDHKNLSILLSTGEVSGDLIGADLAVALQKENPAVYMWGLGGGRMALAGVDILYNSNRMGATGITEPLMTAPDVIKSFKILRSRVSEHRPQAAVLIGYDVFNLVLGRWLRSKKIPTINYFPPQIWLWKSCAGIIARSYDYILTSFVAEDAVYRGAGAKTTFVGHYLRDQVEPVCPRDQKAAKRLLGLEDKNRVVGIFPGSRSHELDLLLPVLLEVVHLILANDPKTGFVLPIADACLESLVMQRTRAAGLDHVIRLSYDSRKALRACDLAVLCSGTVTLEAALMGIPMIVLYRVSPASWITVDLIDRLGLIESKTVGIPNLLAGRHIVPEFIQSGISPSRVAGEAWRMLEEPSRQIRIKKHLARVCSTLGQKGASEKAAHFIVKKATQKPRN